MPASSSTRTTDTGSSPAHIAKPAVSAAPMPTQTAYAVPMGRPRIAKARPAMLPAQGGDEDGGRHYAGEPLGPAEGGRPDGFEDAGDDQDEPVHENSWNAVLSLSGSGPLVRGSCPDPPSPSHSRRGGTQVAANTPVWT